MSTKNMTKKQLLVYGARIRLAWFRKAEELGNTKEACTYFGIPRSSYYYWYSRWVKSGKSLKSLYDISRAPHTHPNQVEGHTKDLILQLRDETGFGKNALSYIMKRDHGVLVSHHGVNNVLSRCGLLKKVTRHARERKLDTYEYYPGERGQLDVKHWKHIAYQYDLIDCATRIKYKRIYDSYTSQYTVDFLRHAFRFFAPAFRFTAIQTDNGTEFTYTQFPHVFKTHPIDVFLQAEKIKHLLIKASSPHLNGRIERSHGVDKAGFKHTKRELSYENLREFLITDCMRYNTYKPHEALGMKTPIEYLQSLPGFENATVDFSILSVS